jgi:hypothetical protein
LGTTELSSRPTKEGQNPLLKFSISLSVWPMAQPTQDAVL